MVAPIQWTLREGTQPTKEKFYVTKQFGDQLVGRAGRPVTLSMSIQGEFPINISHVYITDVSDSTDVMDYEQQPGGGAVRIQEVEVQDRRWLWERFHIGPRRFNMRNPVGVKRPIVPNVPEETVEVEPDLQYKRWSLRDEKGRVPGSKWTANQALQAVMERVLLREAEEAGPAAPFIIEPGHFDELIPIEDLEIDDRADVAISRILDYIPGGTCTVTPQGTVVFYNQGFEDEAPIFSNPEFSEIYGRGHMRRRRTFLTAPRKVIVKFGYKVEVRWDYVERSLDDEEGATQVAVPPRPDEEEKGVVRLLQNVAPLSDHSLQVKHLDPSSGAELTSQYVQGTYVEIEDLMAAFGPPPIGGAPLTLSILRKAALPFLDLTNALFTPDDPLAFLWTARINSLQEHYRTTFQIPKVWMDRILNLEANLLTIVNPATGTGAPAMVWSDYAYLRDSPLLVQDLGIPGEGATYALNVKGYPREGAIMNGTWGIRQIDPQSICPGKVSVVDQAQGIIRIDYVTSPLRYFARVLPGIIVPNVVYDKRRAGQFGNRAPVFWNAISPSSKVPALNGRYRMAVKMTATPAAPNDESQLFSIEVPAGNAALAQLLPGQLNPAIKGASGPAIEVRIPNGVEVARVAWSDEHADVIAERLFGVGRPAGQAPADDPEADGIIAGLIVNLKELPVLGPTTLTRFNELESIALAAAARVYMRYANRFEGVASMPMYDVPGVTHPANLRVRGGISTITFTIAPDGEGTVDFSSPGKALDFPLFGFLPANVRKLVMRLVDDGVAV